jgi:hypothetical protein
VHRAQRLEILLLPALEPREVLVEQAPVSLQPDSFVGYSSVQADLPSSAGY